tara:strand:- start:908 stop:1234 length:327 start_codon:yes stop_codon:yes gene_type:complete
MSERTKSIIGWIFIIAAVYYFYWIPNTEKREEKTETIAFIECLEDNDIPIREYMKYKGDYPSILEIENFIYRIINISFESDNPIEAESLRISLNNHLKYCSRKHIKDK